MKQHFFRHVERMAIPHTYYGGQQVYGQNHPVIFAPFVRMSIMQVLCKLDVSLNATLTTTEV